MKNLLKGIFFTALVLSFLQGVATLFSDTEAATENYQAGSLEINLENYSSAGELFPHTPENCSFLVENTGTLPIKYEISLSFAGALKNKESITTPATSTLNPGQVDTVTLELLLSQGFSPTLKGESDLLEITVSATQVNAIGGFRDEKTLDIPIKVASPAPTFNILSPTTGATVSGKTLIQVEVTDAFGISGVYFTIDQDNQQFQLEDKGSNIYQFLWDSTTLSNGTHTLYFVAYDALNQSASDLVQIDVSN